MTLPFDANELETVEQVVDDILHGPDRRFEDPHAAGAGSRRSGAVSSASAFKRFVMSRAIVEAPVTRPVESVSGEIVSETSIIEPSFRIRCVSKDTPDSPRAAFSIHRRRELGDSRRPGR